MYLFNIYKSSIRVPCHIHLPVGDVARLGVLHNILVCSLLWRLALPLSVKRYYWLVVYHNIHIIFWDPKAKEEEESSSLLSKNFIPWRPIYYGGGVFVPYAEPPGPTPPPKERVHSQSILQIEHWWCYHDNAAYVESSGQQHDQQQWQQPTTKTTFLHDGRLWHVWRVWQWTLPRSLSALDTVLRFSSRRFPWNLQKSLFQLLRVHGKARSVEITAGEVTSKVKANEVTPNLRWKVSLSFPLWWMRKDGF